MNRDIAIIKLTIISTIRSYSFISIALLSCIFAFFIPLTVFGGGSLVDLFQIRIDFSLEVCSILIFISSVWSGCSVMAGDIEFYTIHMLPILPILLPPHLIVSYRFVFAFVPNTVGYA